MIPDDDVRLLEAARAIAAGQRVDWGAIESSAGISDSLAALLREARVVDDIAELHRSLPDPEVRSDHSLSSSADASASAPIPEAATWGALQLLEHVGRGAFGDVYRAWDPRLDREVALKLLKRSDAQEDSVGSMVIDEGRLLARVRHPNIVTVHGADRVDGRVGLWMEFVRGRTLEAILHDHGPFGAREAALIGLDLCRALSAVHRAGLVHRDIKAQNVVREAGGRIVLMDFGTGREVMEGRSTELAGTPLYLAPEVFRAEPASTRSDIYSLGVLLYHLVTSSYPVSGRSLADLREAHHAGRRMRLRDERPDLPDTFIEVVERALEIDPESRHQSAGTMEAALARVVAKTEAPARVGRRTRSVSVAAAAVIVMSVGLLALAWRERQWGSSGSRPSTAASIAFPAPSSTTMRRIPLEEFSSIGSPAPDGTLFSVADTDGNVAVLDLATNQLRRVTTDASFSRQANQYAQGTAISPDGQLIAYGWSALDGQFEIRIIDRDGTQPRVVLRSPAVEYGAPIQWSRDGQTILTMLIAPDRLTSLALVSTKDGAVRTLKRLGTSQPQYASLSPDGEFVVYDAPQQPSTPGRDIFIVRSDGSDDRRLVDHPSNDAQPVWTPDGRAVLFASDRSGSNDIWAIAVDRGFASGEPRLEHRNIGRMSLRGLTDAGSYFYYLTAGVTDVYEAPLGDGGSGKPVVVPTSFSGSNISSVWSPDGRRLAYASRRGTIWFDRGSTTLAIRDTQSGDQRELRPAMRAFLTRSWSPDGRSVLVQGTGADNRQGMYAIDADSGRVTPIVVDGSSARPDWQPSGKITYYSRRTHAVVSRDPSTGAEAIVYDPRSEGSEIVADISGRGYRLSPDGQMLAFTTFTGRGESAVRSLLVKVLGGGPARELVRVKAPELVTFQDWTPDGTAVLFTRWSSASNEPASLWRVSIHGGDPQPMGLSMVGLRDVSVAPDGTKITFTGGWPKNELWVMDNFLARK
jgi:serine/threonine-protein kinase